MEISLYAAGCCQGNGGPNQRAACGVVVSAEVNGVRAWRELAHPLGPVTGPQSELYAALGALEAVRRRYRGAAITLYVPEYVSRVLVRAGDGYAVAPKSNVQLVRRLRALTGEFPQLAVASGKPDGAVRAGELARRHAADQSAFDTGTVYAEVRDE